MDNTLKGFLTEKGYTKVKLKLTKTNHYEIQAIINGVQGSFILDTGASNSCVGFEAIEKFHLTITDSEIKAVGAGASNMETKLSEKNTIKIGAWEKSSFKLVIFNLDHVNQGLLNHNSNAIDGIIGADVLKKAKAIIDYQKNDVFLNL